MFELEMVYSEELKETLMMVTVKIDNKPVSMEDNTGGTEYQ